MPASSVDRRKYCQLSLTLSAVETGVENSNINHRCKKNIQGHFLGIRRGVELHEENVTFFITFTNVFFIFVTSFTFFDVFKFFI